MNTFLAICFGPSLFAGLVILGMYLWSCGQGE